MNKNYFQQILQNLKIEQAAKKGEEFFTLHWDESTPKIDGVHDNHFFKTNKKQEALDKANHIISGLNDYPVKLHPVRGIAMCYNGGNVIKRFKINQKKK